MPLFIDLSCRAFHFLPAQWGQHLESHVFMNISVGKDQCERWCLMDNKCVSVNIGSEKSPNSVICELSDSDHCQHPEDLKPRQGWTYRGAKVSHDKLKSKYFGPDFTLFSWTERERMASLYMSGYKSQFSSAFTYRIKVFRIWDVKLIKRTKIAWKWQSYMTIFQYLNLLLGWETIGKMITGKAKQKVRQQISRDW